MNKVNLLYFFLLICLTSTQARIWFMGEQMPGTNKTIPEEPTSTPSWAPPLNMDRLEEIIGRGVTRMALSLVKVVGNEVDNVIYGPLSIAAALSVILLGAAGRTSAEIAYFLGLLAGVDFTDRTQVVHEQLGRYFKKFESNPGTELGTQLAFANGIFIQEGLSIVPKFDKLARDIYKCEVIPIDFMNHPQEATLIANKWVNNRTNGRINKIVSTDLDRSTRMLVVNALYFNGQWEYPFLQGKTVSGSFHVSKDEVIQIPLMVGITEEIPYYQSKNYKIFGMPYKGGDLTMYIVLPEENLHKFVSNLTVDSVETMINRTKIQKVMYVVPRMKMESELFLREPLENLGIRSLFNPNTADLSGIAEDLYTNNIVHKVEVQVTETGTIASAVTGTIIYRGGMVLVRVVKPFLFFIYHKPTRTIIFWGSVYKPIPYYD